MVNVFVSLFILSIIGFVRPFKFIPFGKRWHYAALAVAFFVGVGVTAPEPTSEELVAKGETAASAIVAYEQNKFPVLFEAVGPELFDRIQELEVGAVYAAAESSNCDNVKVSGVSNEPSPDGGLLWFIDCENGNRFKISQNQAEEALERFNSNQLAQSDLGRSCTTETVGRCDPDNVATSNEEENPYADVSRQYALIVMAKNAIRERLRDPDSAQFRNVRFYSGGGTAVACGEVNAKNGFGGYTGYKQFVGASSQLAFLASDMDNPSEWTEIWNSFCVRAPTDEA